VRPILPPAPGAADAFPGCAILPIAYGEVWPLAAAFAALPGTVWLDSAAADHPAAQRSLLAFEPRTCSSSAAEKPDNPFDHLHQQTAAPARNYAALVALLGYEAGRHVDRMPQPEPSTGTFPEAWSAVYDAVCVFDHRAESAFIAASGWPETDPSAIAAAALDRARRVAARVQPGRAPARPAALSWQEERPAHAFAAAIGQALELIRAGDIYQVNLSLRFLAPSPSVDEIFGLYLRLREQAPAPFGAYLRINAQTALLAASPERFLALDAAGRVRAQPIKGTRPRAVDPLADQRLRTGLRENTKERAENLMIVDLLRNDLSRVCVPGSVQVPSLFAVESFQTVHHLVSTVEGRLQPGRTAVDLLAAAFPGGSVTGAPKLRAMEVIRALETAPRGAYCGSLCLFTPDGAMDSAILIRTIAIADGTATAQAGAGIVADSEPQAEVRETWLKAKALLQTLAPESDSPLWRL
jgi:para-aminobenzoate synthetase component 1